MSKTFSIRSQVLIAGPPAALPPPDRPTYSPGFPSAPVTVSVLNSSMISAPELSVLDGCSTDITASTPVNLVGGGSHRFLGSSARPPVDRHQITAAINAELGTPAHKPIISADGVATFLIPRRAR
jgi:hypothetical protein